MGFMTATDLPIGSAIAGGSSLTWRKRAVNLWVDSGGERFNDAQMDVLLPSGGRMTSVPPVRARWLLEDGEVA